MEEKERLGLFHKMTKDNKQYCCKVASSLGELENTAEIAWGTKEYSFLTDKYKPTVFFGLFDVRDYYIKNLNNYPWSKNYHE